MNPKNSLNQYFIGTGWASGNSTKTNLPVDSTLWKVKGNSTLTPSTPVTLEWDNGEDLIFTKKIELDDKFLFKIEQSIKNNSNKSFQFYPYAQITRSGKPEGRQIYILHEGFLGVFGEELKEKDYDDIEKEKFTISSTKGWLGITDKYWLTALIPSQNENVQSRFLHHEQGSEDKFQVDYLGEQKIILPRETITETSHFFAGAKEVLLLDEYEEKLGVDRFDLAIDFGWFYFLTKPIFYALLWINDRVANLGLAIILLTIGIKILLFPLANKSYTSMSKMKKLHPQMTKLRERFGDDKMKLNQEMML